jgi:hypothetical protein
MSKNKLLDYLEKLLDYLEKELNFTFTENGAVARKTTGSDLLNFFSLAGGLRERAEDEIVRLFDAAFCENPHYAIKALFYFRDIRGGQGERRTFRVILKSLSHSKASKWLRENLNLIPEYGRWDDLFVLFDTCLEKDALELIKNQLRIDYSAKNPSLLAKWLPSENASSKESKYQAKKISKFLEITPRSYRKLLSTLRKRIDVLERIISSNQWDKVDYERVPSQANVLYRNAFRRHDGDRYNSFLESVKKGERTIKAGVLYPYDIVRKCIEVDSDKDKNSLDALWNALPDYLEGTQENAIVVADTSASMTSNNFLPLSISISLAIYAAERNKGVFHNKFITFSESPELQTVKGRTIVDKVRNLSKAAWNMNTNVEAVFDIILNIAVEKKLSQEEMVKKIYIVSDMEFDNCAKATSEYIHSRNKIKETLFETIRNRYEKAGYKMPLLVFWCVNGRNNQFPMSMDDRGFINVSGASASIFTKLIKNEFLDAYSFMIEVLDSPRYERVNYNE